MRSIGMILLIAFRNLTQHKRRTFLLGGAIGAVTSLLIVLLGLSAGVRETMLRSATTLMTGHINIAGFYKVTAGQSAPLVTGYQAILQQVKQQVPEVDYIVERGRGWGRVVSDTASMQVAIGGIAIETEPGFREVIQVVKGSLEALSKPNTVLIFEEQAKRLEVNAGDALTISTTTSRGISNTLDVTVGAIAVNVGMMSAWNIFIELDSLRSLYQLNDDTTGVIQIHLKDMESIPIVEQRLRDALTQSGHRLMEPNPVAFFMKFDSVNREDWTGQKLDITDWEDEISFMSWTLSTIDGLTFILTAILMVIIVVGIMNTMWIAIRERTREVGTLRAIGMHRGRILLMFLIEAFLLGFVGTIFGALGGISFAILINSFGLDVPSAARMFLMSDQLELTIQATSVVISIVVISLITTMAAVYPSIRAARLKPVTAMYHIG